MPWKHDVFLLFSCSTKTLVYSLFSWTFFYSFPERASAAFSKRFPTELLTVTAMKTWCLLIVFLLHENARVELVFLTVFYSFPKRANVAFSKCFHTESRIMKAMKTCCSSIVFLLHGNGSKQLTLFTRMFFCSFRERTSAEFSKCFHTQLLMVNVKKTWCSSIIFLLHGNANEQFVFWNAMKTTCSSIVIIISCSWSCPMKTPVNSLLYIQSINKD